MKISLEKGGHDLVLRYRVYQRRGIICKTYVAKIVGPHPNYILNRCFQELWENSNSRWSLYTCLLYTEGIYEIAIKRFTLDGNYLGRERLWLIIYEGNVHIYEGEEMNNQYVLYCAGLLQSAGKEAG